MVPSAQEATTRLLGSCCITVSKFLGEWNDHGNESISFWTPFENESVTKGKTYPKSTRLPNTLACRESVRDFVNVKRMNAEYAIARQVLDHLIENNFIAVKNNFENTFNNRDFDSVYWCACSYLNRNGYHRARHKEGISLNYEHITLRNRCLRIPRENRSKNCNERLQEVYLDASYFHEHHYHDSDCLYDLF